MSPEYLLFLPVAISTIAAILAPNMSAFLVGHIIAASGFVYLSNFSFLSLVQVATGLAVMSLIAGLVGTRLSTGWYQVLLSVSLIPLSLTPFIPISYLLIFPTVFFLFSVTKAFIVHKRATKAVSVNLSLLSFVSIAIVFILWVI